MLHQLTRARRCFGVIVAFLGALAESILYYRRIKLIVEVLIKRFIFMLAYRAKLAKEFVSLRICSSLMNRVCRIVVFSGHLAPGLVATVPSLSNLQIV